MGFRFWAANTRAAKEKLQTFIEFYMNTAPTAWIYFDFLTKTIQGLVCMINVMFIIMQ